MLPPTLTEQQVQDVYNRFAEQQRRTTLYFVEQVNQQASRLLAESKTDDDGVNNIVTAFAVTASLSRMATEKLILMQEPLTTED